MSPCWFIEPVTAISCRSGNSASADTNAYTSVELALSPSTPEYDCSKQMLAARDNGLSCANRLPKRIPANLQHAQPIHLPDACPGQINQQCPFLNHFANTRLD